MFFFTLLDEGNSLGSRVLFLVIDDDEEEVLFLIIFLLASLDIQGVFLSI